MQHDSGRPLDLKLRGADLPGPGGPDRRATGSGSASRPGPRCAPADVELERFDGHSGRITVNGVRLHVLTGTHGPIHLVEVDGVTHRVSRDEGGIVRSPPPALVVATPLAAGDEVEAGAPVLVLESMKMETVLRAPFRARVEECLVSVGSQVEAGAPLLRLEPLGDAEAAGPGGQRARCELDLPAEPADVPAAERAAQRPERPAQPAARLRRRPARRAPGARRLPGRARATRPTPGSARWPARSSCSPSSPTCPS